MWWQSSFSLLFNATSPLPEMQFKKKGINSEFMLDSGPIFVEHGIGNAHFRRGLWCN